MRLEKKTDKKVQREGVNYEQIEKTQLGVAPTKE